jgi:alpha-glucosidase
MSTTRVPASCKAAGLAEPHHDGSELYVERIGGSAELRLRAPEGAADTVFLRYVRDGEPRTVEAKAAKIIDGEQWWTAELPLRNPVVPYRWLLAGGTVGYCWLNATGPHQHEVSLGDDFRLTAEPSGPDWHLSSVVYEVFMDRFASSGARREPPSWAVPRDWHELPDSSSELTNRELYGGDLPGLELHLDHLESLGVNALWLTPFFPAASNHRYDPSSFDQVDPLLGGEEAFASLVRAAQSRGFKLFGDLSLDHCGVGHDWFARAQADQSSPERSFFLFDRGETHGYATWLSYKEQARFDWRSDELRARMSGIVRGWLERGLDGWRIAAASSVGRYRNLDLNAEIARWTRDEAGEAPLIAEFWHDYRIELDGHGWHGAMNYSGFLKPVWWWLRGGPIGRDTFDVFSFAPAPSYEGGQAASVMRSSRAGLPWDATLQSWLLLDTHDTPRFRNVAGTLDRQLVGIGLQMTSPGVPMIYGGAEIGLEGESGRDSRRTIPWDDTSSWDQRLLGEYTKLVRLRRSSDALARGGHRYVHIGDDVLVYERESKAERLLCLAARAPHEPVSVPLTGLETVYGDDVKDGVLPSHGPAFHVWRIVG